MNIVIDTSFLLSYNKKDDSNYKKAQQIFDESLNGNFKIIIPYIVIAEFLIYSTNIDKSINFCEDMADIIEKSTDNDLIFFDNIPIERRKSLKSNDCLILAICKRRKARLLTFDKKIMKVFEQSVHQSV